MALPYASVTTPLNLSSYKSAGSFTATTGTSTTITLTGGVANNTPIFYFTPINATATGLVVGLKFSAVVSKTAGTCKLTHAAAVGGRINYLTVY
jgi:hypothetical protein